MSLKNYALARGCSLIIAGLSIKEGLVSFEIAPVGKRFESDSGADGMVTRWDTGERRHACKLVLKGASKENQVLSGIHNVDIEAGNGAGVFVMSFNDSQGASVFLVDEAWLEQKAGKVFATQPGDVTWDIMAVSNSPLNFIIGGN